MSGGLGASLSPLGDVGVTGGAGGGTSSGVEIDAAFRFEDQLTAVKRYNETDVFGIGVAPALSYAFRPGAIIADVMRFHQSDAETMTYSWTIAEQLYLTSSLKNAAGMLLSDGIGIHPATTVALGVTLLQSLGIAATPLPSLRYTQTLIDTLAISPQLNTLVGAALVDGLGISPALSPMFRPQPVLADGIGIHPAISTKMTLAVVLDDTIGFDPVEALSMIYDGQLADGIQIITAYVAPDGSFSTWAMNTRTGAVTEYSNYDFNSFALVGDRYFGASSSGLYQLIGDDDAGTSIIADIKTGFAQWTGTQLSVLRGIYLGARGAGNYVLKVVTGDGKTYVYSVNTLNQATTKVTVGKGMRARYFGFELISSGQDFDLDTIEFVPLQAQRRV